MFNSAGLTAIIERIMKGDETEADISTCFETLNIIGLQKDDIQSFIRILRESRQQIPKESESNQKIQIILQNVVQLGEKSNNFGNPKDFTVQNTYQGIDTETFEARIQELQESIHKILLEKNNIESSQSETCVYSSSPETQLILSPLPPSNISTFDYEVVTVDIKGNITKHDSNLAEFFVENLNNEVMLEMVSIRGGTFQMGAPQHEPGSIEDERPQHLVTLKDFFIGKYPVTQDQWRVVASFPKIRYDLEPEPAHFKGNNLPVEFISWNEAQEFCARLSKKTGRNFRLPSEAEWEYACRAREITPFHFGTTITTNLANYCGENRKIKGRLYQGTYAKEPNGIYRAKTTEVGSFAANSFGLYDMHGNVWEWCADYRHENYQGFSCDGTIWLTGGKEEYRILRGGSWFSPPSICRCASRFFDNLSNRTNQIGFRVVCSFV